jgi:hypothetical protein
LTAPERALEPAGLLAIDLIQALGDHAVVVLGQKLGYCGGVELAAGDAEPLGKRVGGFEEVVGSNGVLGAFNCRRSRP